MSEYTFTAFLALPVDVVKICSHEPLEIESATKSETRE